MMRLRITAIAAFILLLVSACSNDIDNLKTDIYSVNQRIESINNTIDKLKGVDESLKTYIASLETELKSLEEKYRKLTDDIDGRYDELLKQIQELQNKVATLKDEDAYLQKQIDEFTAEVNRLYVYIDSGIDDLKSWADSTFMTYAQYLELKNSIDGINRQLEEIDDICAILSVLEQSEENYEIEFINSCRGILNEYTTNLQKTIEKATAELKAEMSQLDTRIKKLDSGYTTLESRIEELEKKYSIFESIVQTMVVVPDNYDKSVDVSAGGYATIKLMITPGDAQDGLVSSYKKLTTDAAKRAMFPIIFENVIKTKAQNTSVSYDVIDFTKEGDMMNLTVRIHNLIPESKDSAISACVHLISDSTSVATDYFPLRRSGLLENGLYSVNDHGGKVKFTGGDLYLDGTKSKTEPEYRLESEQWIISFDKTYQTIATRFYWLQKCNVEYQFQILGNSHDNRDLLNYPEYCNIYIDKTKGVENNEYAFFADDVDVEGISDLMTLTKDEFVYITGRKSKYNGKSLTYFNWGTDSEGSAIVPEFCPDGKTEAENHSIYKHIGVFLFPDDYEGDPETMTYSTWEDLNDDGVVFLPAHPEEAGSHADPCRWWTTTVKDSDVVVECPSAGNPDDYPKYPFFIVSTVTSNNHEWQPTALYENVQYRFPVRLVKHCE